MKKLIFAVLLLSLFHLPFYSQETLPSGYFTTKLDNGLKVLVVEDRDLPIVTIEIDVKNGSYTEPPEFSGLSHFYEHMFFKANKDIPSQEEYIKRMQELGMIWNGTTSVNRVNYFFTMPSMNLEPGLKFMNNAIRYPLFTEDEIKKEHDVVNGEFQRNESDPEFQLWDEWDKHMWGANYCRKNPIGNHDVILSATTEKMKTIQHKYYWPNNSMLVVAGDVEHSDVFEKVKNIYGSWEPSGFDPFEKWPVPEFEPLTDDVNFITNNENANAPEFLIGWQGPDTRNDIKGTYTADVFSELINLESSRLHKDLVDGGLAVEMNVYYETSLYTGPIMLHVTPNPKKIKECLAKVLEHIGMWDSEDYFSGEQLETAKNKITVRMEYSTEQTTRLAHILGYWWAMAGLQYFINYNENINKITMEDIKNCVETYIKNKPKVSVMLISPQMQQAMNIKSFNDILN